MSTKKYDLFFSHNSQDKRLVKQIAERLYVDYGIRPWLDAWDIPGGADWGAEIERALNSCTACAIFLGGNRWGKTWHLREAKFALDRQKRYPDFPVIPVLLPGARNEDTAELGDFFEKFQRVDFQNGLNDEEMFRKLAASIEKEGAGPPPMSVRSIERDAKSWDQSGRTDKNILYPDGRLQKAQKIAKENVELSGLALEFLAASAAEQTRKRRQRVVSSILVAITVIVFSLFAWLQLNQANLGRAAAESTAIAEATGRAAAQFTAAAEATVER